MTAAVKKIGETIIHKNLLVASCKLGNALYSDYTQVVKTWVFFASFLPGNTRHPESSLIQAGYPRHQSTLLQRGHRLNNFG
jgi:hypothetical protein